MIASVARHEWFHSDEWDFISRRVGEDPPTGIWVSHNEHPSVVPILLWRALFAVVGARHYWPYLAALVLTHLALVVVVWLAARRVGAGPAAALGAASVLALCGAGQQDLLSAFQVSFVGSVLATWAGTLLADHPRRSGAHAAARPRAGGEARWARLALTWAVLLLGLGSSLVSLPLLVLPVSVAWVRRGIGAGAATGAVPLAGFALWYGLVGRDGPAGHPHPVPADIPAFVAHGVVSIFGSPIGVPGSGVVACVVVAAAVASRFRHVDRQARAAPAVLAIAAAVVNLAFMSVGRTYLGTEQAGTSRYVYIGVALVLPACALLATRLRDLLTSTAPRVRLPQGAGGALHLRVPALATVVAVLAVAAVDVRGVALLHREEQPVTALAASVRPQFRVASDLLSSGQLLLAQASVDPGLGIVLPSDFLRLRAEHAFGQLPEADGPLTATARLRLQVALAPPPGASGEGPVLAVGLDGPRPVAADPLRLVAVVSGSASTTSRGTCTTVAPVGRSATLVVRTPRDGGLATLQQLASGDLRLGLKTGTSGPGAESSHLVELVGTSIQELVSTAATARVLVTVVEPVRFCVPVE